MDGVFKFSSEFPDDVRVFWCKQLAFADEVFKANVAKHKTYYESLRAQLGIVDFNPLTVDWTTPVPWGNDPDNCKMEDSSGAARQP